MRFESAAASRAGEADADRRHFIAGDSRGPSTTSRKKQRSGGEWLRVSTTLNIPAGETYSGEPVVATFCEPGKIDVGHINPAVAFPGEQSGDFVSLEVVAEIPERRGTFELWILVEREPATMRKVRVRK